VTKSGGKGDRRRERGEREGKMTKARRTREGFLRVLMSFLANNSTTYIPPTTENTILKGVSEREK
jgi:hypothetical protein